MVCCARINMTIKVYLILLLCQIRGSYYYYEYSPAIVQVPIHCGEGLGMPDSSVQNRSQARRSISQLPVSAVPWGYYKMFLPARAVLSGVPPGLCLSRDFGVWEWFLLVSAWYFNWHIKFLIYLSFVFLIIPLCGCRQSAERKLAERNGTDTLGACSSGIIRFRAEGAGCLPCEQFPEGLAHGGTRRGASGAPRGLTEMLLFCFLRGHPWALSSPESPA